MVQGVIARTLRQLIVVLTIFAFLSGTVVQAMPMLQANGQPSAVAMKVAKSPCDHMAAMEQSGKAAPGQKMPCKGITPGCMKQIGCIGLPGIPARAEVLAEPLAYSSVVSWPPELILGGLSLEPDLFPPIAG
jgi:hypothetical protein